VSVKDTETCQLVFDKMQKYGISQIPVRNESGDFIGSVEENVLYRKLMSQGCSLDSCVNQVMSDPYPIVGFADSIEAISKRINEKNSSCLVMDMGGNWHIITKQDIIQAISLDA
jgi:cystathionine beta-synthase